MVVNTKKLFLDTTNDGYAPVWLLSVTIETEVEGLHKLLPANKADLLCQACQSRSNLHELQTGSANHLLDDIIQHERHEEALADALLLTI